MTTDVKENWIVLEVGLSLLWKLLSGALSQKSEFPAENDVDPPNMRQHCVAHYRASTVETSMSEVLTSGLAVILNDLYVLLY